MRPLFGNNRGQGIYQLIQIIEPKDQADAGRCRFLLAIRMVHKDVLDPHLRDADPPWIGRKLQMKHFLSGAFFPSHLELRFTMLRLRSAQA